MRAIIWVMGILLVMFPAQRVDAIVIPPMPNYAPEIDEDEEWAEFWVESFVEAEDAFTALFNSYETRWSKNNRLMMRSGNSGSYRFVAKA